MWLGTRAHLALPYPRPRRLSCLKTKGIVDIYHIQFGKQQLFTIYISYGVITLSLVTTCLRTKLPG